MPYEPDPHDDLPRLRQENVRLQRLVSSLMDRVERTTSSANSPFGFFQITADLSEQLAQQQAALRDSQQTLQAIFDAAPIGILLFNSDLILQRANDWAANMLGLSAEKVVGQSLGAAIRCPKTVGESDRCGKTPACAGCVLRHLLDHAGKSDRSQCEHELSLAARPGLPAKTVWLSLKTEPVMIADAPHMLLSLEDISTKKLAERQLLEAKDAAEEASRQKSRFLSNVSHEIRTPLNGIMGFAEAILHSTTLDTARQQSQIILRESTVLLRLVNDLLDLVKIESGKLVLEQVPVDLSELLRELSQTAGLQTRAKGLGFVASIAVDVPPRILSDPLRLRQILLNLISNAIKFTQHGEVRISIERDPDETRPRIRVAVRDTGIGIPANKQQAIFETFTQADTSTTRKFGGTGLGLAIVRQLVGLMGGEVGVDSAPGQGSTFWFFLPVTVASSTPITPLPQPTATPVAHSARPGHILFAEDYPTNQEIARLFLEQAGHHVTIVSNGREAVDICSHMIFDLILMDLHMPVMDGQTATNHIRQGQTPNSAVPIVALTASADAETQAACLHSGINAVLTKPFRRESLLTAVAKWLEQNRPADPPRAQITSAPAATPPQNQAPPIDLIGAIDEFGGREVVARLLERFLEHADAQLLTLRSSLESLERDSLRRAAHTLKGAAATLEAAPLAHCAAELEAASATAGQPELRPLVDSVALELKRLAQYTENSKPLLENADHALPRDR